MTEAQPSEHQKLILELASTLRGSIVTSYAQVEFLLADLVMRCHSTTPASQLKFPHAVDSRVKAVRDLTTNDPRFAPYRDDLERLVNGLSPYRQIRDMMAHGMQLLRTHGDTWHQLDYRMYRVAKGGIVEIGQMNTDTEQLGRAALEIGRFAQQFVTLWRRIYLDLKLEPVA